MHAVIAIGIATLDIINTVETYPPEDAEVRACQQRFSRGGNATNTLIVLSQLGHRCAWGGVWVDEPDSHWILADLARYQIDIHSCRIVSEGKTPTSYITLSQHNGSRTIVHYRDLPEFRLTDFQRIDLAAFDWLHFEGRQVEETVRMLQWARQQRPEQPISIEIEKYRPHIERLFPYASLLLYGRGFAQHQGYTTAVSFLKAIRSQVPAIPLVCAWGEAGAYALDENNNLLHSPAYPPAQIVDTLGAGDTFNAGIIDGLSKNHSLYDALKHACQLAGEKCGQMGLSLKLTY